MYHPYGIIHVMVVIKNLNFFLVLIEETEQYDTCVTCVQYVCTCVLILCTTWFHLYEECRTFGTLEDSTATLTPFILIS